MNEEKLTLNLPYLERKADSFATNEYVVEKALPVSNSRFRQIIEAPMKDHKEIEDNIDSMFHDGSRHHCLLIYDYECGDGLLVESEGYSYARYAQFIPQAKTILEQFVQTQEMVQSELEETGETEDVCIEMGGIS